ncbi:MAG: pentapeptide repeat-containing protein [Lachnospiraceae bacterium]|nr:pentapeptide repeat-containing protein [Lachnospiraceae bacterium]
MQYRDRTRVNEATLIADYENIAARIFNYNNDICPFGSGDDENKELIYLFLTKNEEEKGDEPEEGTDGQKKRGAKKRGGRRKEGRLGFLHGSFRQYFLARYLVSGIRKSCAEGGKEEFLDFFRNLRARPIYEHLVWTFVYELVRIGGTEQDPFRDTMPNEDAEPDWPLTMKEIKAVRKFLDDEMAFADWMAGDAAYEQGPDAQKQRWLMAENAVFNLVSALVAAERACREEGEEADGYRNYTNLARLLRRGYWGSDVGIYLEGAELAGCNLYRANLANAYLAGACLKGASLRSANLKGAELEGADLRDTTFEGADLSGAVIRNAFFRGANFAGANLTDAILEDASPDGPDAGEDGNGEKGAEAGRENTVFKGANLTGAKMKVIHLENADLVGANLANADLTDAILKSAILTGADLANADLSGAILEGAYLTGSNLKGADLSGAILTGAHLDGADLREAWLIGAELTGAHLMDAYLDRAVLKNAILTDAHLERTHLEGAELSGAIFRNAHLEGANLKAAYLDALIPGQTAVTNGDLSGCSDLTGAYLSGTDLHGAYISDSQFQYARKRGATGRPFTAPGEKLRSYPGRIRDVLKVAGKGSRQAAELVGGMGQIAFGRYKQGGNGEMLPLRWRVLKIDVEKNRVLLITEKLIDCRVYHNEHVDITWKKCDLRKWLNKEFLQEAFTLDERERIAVTDNENPDNAIFKTPGGSSTDDRIFLLSMDEAEECFRDDRDRRADVTPYAKGQYRRSDFYSLFGDEGMGWWWLRSPGYVSLNAAIVNFGGVNDYGHYFNYSALSVRPALWLNL